jgi:hypothetical protein
MSNRPATAQALLRPARSWQLTSLAFVLLVLSIGVGACSSTATTSQGATSTTREGQSSGTASSSEPATGAESVTAVCTDVSDTQATLARTKVVPADAAQKILADSQSSGNAKLESEASALATASHVLDNNGTESALAAMAATCHEVRAGS